jgi:hypothetical protein
MTFVCKGREYHCVIGSDVQRDGMYLEIAETSAGPEIVEIFYSDQTHEMTVTTYRPDVPLEVVEWAIAKARERLIPTSKR